MKKFYSLILALILIPTIFWFGGCSKSAYKLSNLEQDYSNIFDFYTIQLDDMQFNVDYSNYSAFNAQVQSSVPYSYLNNYNQMLKNMMSFADGYLTKISAGSFNVSDKLSIKLKNKLNNLKTELAILDNGAVDCATKFNVQDPQNALSVNSLKSLFEAYSNVFEAAFEFNSTLIDIYFSGTNITDYTEGAFDALRATFDCKLEARITQQIVYTTAIVVETEFDSSNFIKGMVGSSNFGGKQQVYNSYINTISRINKSYTEQNVETVTANEGKTANFKNLMIELNNIQSIYANDMKYYRSAIKNIDYLTVVSDINATSKELVEISQINNFKQISTEYNNVLAGLLSILLGA